MSRTGERVLVIFLLLRMLLVLVTFAEPDGALLIDSRGYVGLARRLEEQGAYYVPPNSEPDLLRPPGYPLFLVGVRAINGDHPGYVTLFQLALSGITSWLILALGKTLKRPEVGLAGAWLYALSPNVILWSLMLMTEVLAAFLLISTVLIVVSLRSRSWRGWPAIAGAMLALAAYVRPINLVLIPLWGGIVYALEHGARSRRSSTGAALLLMATGLTVVMPWLIRNWTIHQQFTFSTAASKTWIGFNLASVLAEAEGIPRNRAVAQLDSDRGLLSLTVEVVNAYPVEFVKGQLLGVARTMVGIDVGTWGNALGENGWVGLGILSSVFQDGLEGAVQDARGSLSAPDAGIRLALIGVGAMYSLVLMGLAAAGLYRLPRNGAEGFVFWLFAGSLLVLIVLPGAAGQARFRVPAEPILAWFAGYGWHAVRLLRNRSPQRRVQASSLDADSVPAN